MRAAVRRPARLMLRAEAELAEAGAVIANGYLRLDLTESIRVVEKSSAALAGASALSPTVSLRARETGSTGRHERH